MAGNLLFPPKCGPDFVHSFLGSVATSSSFSSHKFFNCSSPRESASVFSNYLRSHFSVFQPKTLRSRAETTFPCPEESHSFFCSPFSPAKFLAAATNVFLSIATGLDKVAYPMLQHLPCSVMDFLLLIFNLSWFLQFFPSGRHLYFPFVTGVSLSIFLLSSSLFLFSSCLKAF